MKITHVVAALTLACLVTGPTHPGGIVKPKGGQSAARVRRHVRSVAPGGVAGAPPYWSA